MAGSVERDIKVVVKLAGDEKFKKQMKDLSVSVGGANSAFETMKGVFAAQTIQKALKAIADYAKEAYDASVEFESALAGVAKTMDISDVKLEYMGQQLMELSERIPTTAIELAGLAEIAGQLGIAEDDVIDFVEVVAAMGVSTNVSAEEAATAFARIANIFGTSSNDYERMGSTIVELGNKFATSESEIINMAYNMAGMGATVDMTEADIFALATALSSLGIQSEAGGSAMQKLFQNLEEAANTGKNLQEFATAAQMTEEAFADLWNNDPSKAFLSLMEGLNQIDASGGSLSMTLKDMGINEIRLTRSTTALANGYETLAYAQKMAETAWQENQALSTEAEKRYATSESRVQIAKNKGDNLKIEVGDLYKGLVVGTEELQGDLAAWLRDLAGETSLKEQVENASAGIEDEKYKIEQTAKVANDLVKKLSEMGDVTEMDDATAAEYFNTLGALAEIMPAVGKGFNIETGEIYGDIDSLYTLISETEEAGKLQIDYEAAREAADAYVLALKKQQEREVQLIRLQAQRDILQKEHDELYANEDRTPDEESRYIDVTNDLQQATVAVAVLEQEIKNCDNELNNYAYTVGAFESATQAYTEGAEEAAAETTGFSSEINLTIAKLNVLNDQLIEIRDEYDEVYTEIKEGLDKSFGGFNIVQPVDASEIVPYDLIQRLKDQQAYIEQYKENLEIVQNLGLDSDIIEQYFDGSTSSATILAALAQASPEEVETINAEYKKAGEARDELAKSLAEAQTGLETSVASIVTQANELIEKTDVGNEMYQNGVENIQAIINGMNAKIPALIAKQNKINSILSQTGGGNSNSSGGGNYNKNGMNPVPHAAGLSYVPFDGYLAKLHKGEMVLTALEAKAYRAEQYANYEMMARLSKGENAVVRKGDTDNSVHVEFGGVTVRDNGDIAKIARGIAKINRKNARGVGAR